MNRSLLIAVVTVMAIAAVGPAGAVAAQSAGRTVPTALPIQLSGGPAGLKLELFVNAGKVADVVLDVNGDGASVLDLSNLGKVQVRVYVDVCQDGKVMKVLVVAGQPAAEDQGCRRRIAGAAWWSDCGATRVTLDLAKFGTRVIGCGSILTKPKVFIPLAAVGLVPLALIGGGDNPTAATGTPTVTAATSMPTSVQSPAPPPAPAPPSVPVPVNFELAAVSSYFHPGGNTTLLCVAIVTNPPQAGAVYVVNFSGPGIVSGGIANGMLDAQGRATVRATINLFGMYVANVGVTSSGVTRTASSSVNVVAANSQCPGP